MENKKPPLPPDFKDAGYKIVKLPSNCQNIYLRPSMKNGDHPKPPFRMFVCGRSGGGKSNTISNMFSSILYYGPHEHPYFHKRYLLSSTNEVDDLIDYLNIPEENIFDEYDVQTLKDIIDEQRRELKKVDMNVADAPRVCVIFDDVQSDIVFLKSKAFRTLAIAGRKYGISFILIGHQFTSTPKFIRSQCTDFLYFNNVAEEDEAVIDAYRPAGCSKKKFKKILNFILANNEYNFMYVKNSGPQNDRYRNSFEYVIDINGTKE